MNFSKSNILFVSGFVLIFSLLSIFSYRSTINEFPKYIHSWSQSDRYALALGYLDNGFDLFYPATGNLRPQEDIVPEAETGITGADLPVHEFVIAAIMKISGTKEPVIFRLYTLIVGLIGLFFLGLLVRKITSSIIIAFAIPLFVFFSPVYHYYLAGFIPSITSLSALFIAFWFMYRYMENELLRDFTLMVLFLVIAIIPRISFLIFVPAFAIPVIKSYIKNTKVDYSEVIIALSGLTVIVALYYWKIYLTDRFGSGFLGGFMPAQSFGELKAIAVKTLDNWKYQYFSVYQYTIIILMIAGYLFLNFKGKLVRKSGIPILFPILMLFWALVYSFKMVRQYADHDYYFLDSFFPVIIMFVVIMTPVFRQPNRIVRFTAYSILLTLLAFSAYENSNIQKLRRVSGDWDRPTITAENFEGSAKFLDSLGVSRGAKILVIDAYTSNTALILMERKGWALLNTRPETIRNAFKFDFDFVVMQDRWILSDVITGFPEIMNLIERAGGNGKISVYKRTDNPQKLLPFLGINRTVPYFHGKTSFEDVNDTIWINNKQIEKVLKKDSYGFVNRDYGFGATIKIKNDSLFNETRYAIFSGTFYLYNKNKDFRLVFQLQKGDKTVVYDSRDIRTLVPETEKWCKAMVMVPLKKLSGEGVLSVYITNREHGRLCYDEFSLELY